MADGIQQSESGAATLMRKTESEALFEAFCSKHHLDWKSVLAGPGKTLDYQLQFGPTTVLVEIEQIESLNGFNPGSVHSRTVGSHVRHKISEARRQLQTASLAGLPALLLVYNAVDPSQAFGTESHDFISAMYGELTVRLVNGRARDSFQGRNAKLRHDANTSFSGVGHLRRTADCAEVTIFENIYAKHLLPFDSMPPCFEFVRVEIDHVA
jgi:hypothetical protein